MSHLSAPLATAALSPPQLHRLTAPTGVLSSGRQVAPLFGEREVVGQRRWGGLGPLGLQQSESEQCDIDRWVSWDTLTPCPLSDVIITETAG
ncbi:hypothetical protein AAFF_G00279010 [Aldrovandia affinis]|uniref:Uncharacterized protein n=1 Tax=Aldrovandia affinis TaxID=143900 RepID=A0AAD7SR55_9TELE|nr:hypothetical protein AAFF_G00279010 [Aldrovandia affinis]